MIPEREGDQATRKANKTGVFLHIFKCGGSSVARVFTHFTNLHIMHFDSGGRFIYHNSEDQYGAGGDQFTEADFTFTFVRNPLSRVEGLQRSCVQVYPQHAITIRTLIDLAKSPTMPSEDPWRQLWRHTRPASVSAPIIDRMDHVVRREDYAGQQWIEDQLGIPKFPHANRSPGVRRPHREAFSPNQIKWMKQIYAADLERWDYDLED